MYLALVASNKRKIKAGLHHSQLFLGEIVFTNKILHVFDSHKSSWLQTLFENMSQIKLFNFTAWQL